MDITDIAEDPIECSPDVLFELAEKYAYEQDKYILSQKESCENAELAMIREAIIEYVDKLLDPEHQKTSITSLGYSTGRKDPKKYYPLVERVLAEFNCVDNVYEYRITDTSNWGSSKEPSYFVDIAICKRENPENIPKDLIAKVLGFSSLGTSDPKYAPDFVVKSVEAKKNLIAIRAQEARRAIIEKNMPIVRKNFLNELKKLRNWKTMPINGDVCINSVFDAEERAENGTPPDANIWIRVNDRGITGGSSSSIIIKECLESILVEFNALGSTYEYYIDPSCSSVVQVRRRGTETSKKTSDETSKDL
jgi:hypothetical protein